MKKFVTKVQHKNMKNEQYYIDTQDKAPTF